VLARTDVLVVNRTELQALTGSSGGSVDEVLAAHRQLRAAGVGTVLTTLGAHGSVWTDAASSGYQRSLPAGEVVDTTGAGDMFVGSLAARLAAGDSIAAAVRFATAAAGLSVTAPGTIPSYPAAAAAAAAAAALPPLEILEKACANPVL
jgi:ribokinase